MLTLLAATAIATQLYRLQVVEGQASLRKARASTIVVERHNSPRGKIFDCQRRLLVTNEPEVQLEAVVAEIPDVDRAIPLIARALEVAPEVVERIVRKAQREGPLEPVVLARTLSTQQAVAATDLVRHVHGLKVSVRERRRYIGANLGAQMLGYTGEINVDELARLRSKGYASLDRVGKEGLEEHYDSWLRGRPQLTQVSVDALGRSLRVVEQRAAQPGAALILNVDWNLQKVAEEALAVALQQVAAKNGQRSGGCVIAMEAATGRIRALASLPQYDARQFSRGIKSAEYRKLLTDPGIPLIYRAISSAYAPGSTFKLINSSAALHEHLCTPTSGFYCSGSYLGAHCFVRSGHGHINFVQSLALSCDVVYYMLGVRLGVGRLVRYAAMYGLGRRTGIDVPGEVSGNLPDPRWKQKVWKSPWFQGDTVNLSIGQGFLLVTPLQMAVVTAAVANGGLIVGPHLVDRLMSFEGRVLSKVSCKPLRRLPFRPGELAAVREGMRGAVLYGTATAANCSTVEVSGKTGTVENTPSSENPQGRNHTWFVSFAPRSHAPPHPSRARTKPQLVVVVFLEKTGGYGGGVAAPVARKIYDYWFRV